MNALTIGASKIHQIDGLYSLNDLHKAAGGNPAHRPGEFIRLQQTSDLIVEIENAGIPAFKTQRGANGGTYACRELVIAYAAWISPAFHLKVIRVFLGTINPPAAFERGERIGKGSRALPAEIEQAISERVWDLIRIYSETIRLEIRERVLSEPARAFDIINTANLTDSLIPAQTRELRHIARLLDALLSLTQDMQRPKNGLTQRENMP